MGKLNYDMAPAAQVASQSVGDFSNAAASTEFVNRVVPAGVVFPYAGPVPPEGWLLADGSAVSRTLYPRLFAAIGTTYGAGNGTTTFNLPDLRGEFVRGLDNGRGVDSGRGLGSAQQGTSIFGTPINTTSGALASNQPQDWDQLTGTTNGFGPPGTSAANGTGRYSVRPRNVAMNYIIKAV